MDNLELIRIMREISKELRGIRKELKIMNRPNNEEELIYDQDEAVEFIKQDCRTSILSESAIRKVLDVEEDYMRSKGIIED